MPDHIWKGCQCGSITCNRILQCIRCEVFFHKIAAIDSVEPSSYYPLDSEIYRLNISYPCITIKEYNFKLLLR